MPPRSAAAQLFRPRVSLTPRSSSMATTPTPSHTATTAAATALRRGAAATAAASAVLSLPVLSAALGGAVASCAAAADDAIEGAATALRSALNGLVGGSGGAGAGEGGGWDDEAAIRKAVQLALPFAQQLGFGGAMGACSAYAFKVVGRTAAYYVGLGFLTLQVLSYPWFTVKDEVTGKVQPKAFLQVNWEVLANWSYMRGMALLDKDGDGVVTEDEAVNALMHAKSFLAHNVPNASGFGLGFYLGLRYL
jgi:uncharacterized membrane protein (Fun14 family)